MVASHVAPIGDLAHNPRMCPDWGSNWQPFGSQPALNPLSYTSHGMFLANHFNNPLGKSLGQVISKVLQVLVYHGGIDSYISPSNWLYKFTRNRDTFVPWWMRN